MKLFSYLKYVAHIINYIVHSYFTEFQRGSHSKTFCDYDTGIGSSTTLGSPQLTSRSLVKTNGCFTNYMQVCMFISDIQIFVVSHKIWISYNQFVKLYVSLFLFCLLWIQKPIIFISFISFWYFFLVRHTIRNTS